MSERKTYFCAATAVKIKSTQGEDGKWVHQIDRYVSAFAVKAVDYAQALGIAELVTRHMDQYEPGWLGWLSTVSDIPDDVITDPDNIIITPNKKRHV